MKREPGPLRDRLNLLLSAADGEASAIEFDDVWVSWASLRALAAHLWDLLSDLPPASRIGVVLENRPEHVLAVAAILAKGHCVITLSPMQPTARLSGDIATSAVPVLLGSPNTLAETDVIESAGAARRISLQPDLTALVLAGGDLRALSDAERRPGVAIEMLTSGTTGAPKRVQLTDRQLDRAMVSSGQAPRDGAALSEAVTIVATPIVHIGGMWSALASLAAGRRIALLPRFTVGSWVPLVERHRPRAAGLVPAALQMVLDAKIPREALSSLQVVTSGTAPCPAALAEEFLQTYGIRVLLTYGATEFAGAVAGWTYALHKEWWETKAGSAGRALPGVELQVVDADGRQLPAGEQGMLQIRTAQSSAGENEWVSTSDLAALDEDGFLWIRGRADDAIIRGGFKVHPDTVRKVLESHPAIREASVVGFPDDRLGAVPVAVVELVPGADQPSEDDLMQLCRDHLTGYEVPRMVFVTDELPRTPSYKVSRPDVLDFIREQVAAEDVA